jgi:hypothetical protein
MKITYGITVCNEHAELDNLIKHITPYVEEGDEIVVVYDQNRVTSEVMNVLNQNSSVSSFGFDFQQNFLENKNYMNSKCKGDYIFQIDADEIPHETLLSNLKTILVTNKAVDLLITPRKNLVEGLTQQHIQKWGWHVNEQGWVNWPDPQKRIYRNDPKIKWIGHQVHGMVEGYKTYTVLPFEEDWCIVHNKTIDRQQSQNDRYARIEAEK